MTGPEDGDRERDGIEDGDPDNDDREELLGSEDPAATVDPGTDDDVDGDPFERRGTDDEVDPFAELGDDRNVDHESGGDHEESAVTQEGRDATYDESPDRTLGARTEPDGADDGTDPFAELDASPDPDAPPGSDGDPFERMAVDEVDMDDVWDALDDDLPPVSGDESGPDTRSDDIVDKRTYCQRCPHFAEPPETACTLEGTDIVEVIGFDELRLRGCPMVSEDGPSFDRSR